MHARLPSSCGSMRIQVAAFDVVWAAISPALALYLRDAQLLSAGWLVISTFYSLVALVAAVTCFVIFRLGDGLTPYFSLPDAGNVLKAVVCTAILTCIASFGFTRLEGVPRSTPVIHALLLGTGLIAARITAQRFLAARLRPSPGSRITNVVMLGSNPLTAAYIRMIQTCLREQCRVVGVLDERAQLVGRAINGIHIIGHPQQLERVIDEFKIHGVPVDRVLVGGDESVLPTELLSEIRQVCERRVIGFDFVPQLQGFSDNIAVLDHRENTMKRMALTRYHRSKRALDFGVALVAAIATLPISALVAVVVFLDVGSPLLFWQQRVGRCGHAFLLYKFRTLHLPVNHLGKLVSEEERLSRVGEFLRRTRLDELPQLLNVLSGDMSLVGPRPLLPADQPPDPTVRLSIRPGITGWAQVNGGRALDALEKNSYDEWYVRNASFWVDVRILLMSFGVFFRGERHLAGRPHQSAPQNPSGVGAALQGAGHSSH
ncbi:sugar transferase [Microvirga massiliensis]|uniref:sugar transferase n=1 Tax=Microvirga massiliensis TaxID=1033741 RepID=UPI00069B31AD|nr:sugar transferase [Microvirga massiliensis]